MTATDSAQAQNSAIQDSNQAFERLAEPFRRELKLHCYRMLGSVHEAEDLVQDTFLRAWRAFDSFTEGRSFRAWLYRIATNACLSALAARKSARRRLPDQLGPSTTGFPEGPPATEIAWLEPYPDAQIDSIADDAPNPEARYTSREAVKLAFIAAIQHLPPRQRAALLLCDVLGWSASEAATQLDGSTAAVNSALQRARHTVARTYPADRKLARPNPAQQQILERYLRAWEAHDLDGLAALLKEDATFTMPPWSQWYVGRATIRDFFATAWQGCRGVRLLVTASNGQPALAVYERAQVGGTDFVPQSLHVLTLDGDGISALTMFVGEAGPQLFPAFGLPSVFPDAGGRS